MLTVQDIKKQLINIDSQILIERRADRLIDLITVKSILLQELVNLLENNIQTKKVS
jgi:hypothetical protein